MTVAEQTATLSAEPGLQADERLLARGWLRIGAGLAVAAQAMVFSLAVNVTPADGAGYWVVHGGLLATALGVLVFLGSDLVGSAWEALRARRVSIDLLFLVTLAGALAGSLVSTLTRTGSIYYEVVSVLVVVHTVGKLLGARSRAAALHAVDRTRETFAQVRVRTADGGVLTKPVAALAPHERVLVVPGGAIAVDGTIERGRGYVQETSMTGEWRPASRGPGDAVLAGTYSVDGDFEIAPSAGPRRLDAILAEVARARLAPSALQRQADRLMAWFLPLVVGVSAATFAFWWFHAPWERALFNAMAVLLVACPCAMGLATPIAVWGGLARLASFGVVARTGDFLDALARCDTVCFDKTGTLSEDRLVVLAWQTAPAWHTREAWLKGAVGSIESMMQHPIAKALTESCHTLYDKFPERGELRLEPGRGVVGRVRDERGEWMEVRVGERELHEGVVLPAAGEAKRVFVSVKGEYAASVELGETWRVGLEEALGELQSLGVAVEILTGDPHPPVGLGGGGRPPCLPGSESAGTGACRHVIPVRGGLTPAEKQRRVEALVAEGRTVLFAGDGVNDAAAMGAAHASIALRGGSELARAAAMAVFAGDDLRFLPRALRIARGVRTSIRGNLLFASAYNLAGMALAAAGVLHPVVAALLMVGSSAAVAWRALRASGEGVVSARVS